MTFIPGLTPTHQEAEDAVRTLIAYIGDDPTRPGIRDTPRRVLDAWRNAWGAGYERSWQAANIADHDGNLRLFRENVPDEMIVQQGIQFYSHCEHHLAPFFGEATIAYVPAITRGVIGLSKLSRIVDMHARQLQVQERLTKEIAAFLHTHLSVNVAVVMKAQHLCMASRGVCQQGAITTTSCLHGVFRDDPKARAEFLAFVK